MVHQRSEENWLERRWRDFIRNRSYKDKELNETVFTRKDAKVLTPLLKKEFPTISHRVPDLGQVLADGRGQGGFQV